MIKIHIIIIAIILITTFELCVSINWHISGALKSNVCTKAEEYTGIESVVKTKIYNKPEFISCYGFPPRCENKTFTVIENITVTKIKFSYFCCENFILDDIQMICFPKCRNNCINGECSNATGECLCFDGYSGENCTEKCPHNRYGKNCSGICDLCSQYQICDHINGNCVCPLEPEIDNKICLEFTKARICKIGFMGEACNETCQSNYYGQNCTKICNCTLNEICDPIAGCKLNIHESSRIELIADKECPDGFFAKNCTEKCSCKFITVCDKINGKCNVTEFYLIITCGILIVIIIIIIIKGRRIKIYGKSLQISFPTTEPEEKFEYKSLNYYQPD